MWARLRPLRSSPGGYYKRCTTLLVEKSELFEKRRFHKVQDQTVFHDRWKTRRERTGPDWETQPQYPRELQLHAERISYPSELGVPELRVAQKRGKVPESTKPQRLRSQTCS